MEIVLEPDDQGAVSRAARAAAQREGLLDDDARPAAWWLAGLADAVERTPHDAPAGSRYAAPPSPRSTRGATRA